MRVPIYTSEGTVRANSLATPNISNYRPTDQVVDLSGVTNFALGIYEDQKREEEKQKREAEAKADRDRKLYTQNMIQRSALDLDSKYSELQEAIKSGGDYSKSLDLFNKHYEKISKEAVKHLADDPLLQENTALKLASSHSQYSNRLKTEIERRTLSDTITLANERAAINERQFFEAETPEDQQKVFDRYSDMIASLEASGVINDGKERIRSFLTNGVEQKVTFLMQSNPKSAKEALEEYKTAIDIDSYINLNARVDQAVLKQKANDALTKRVEMFGRGELSPDEATQEQVEMQAEDVVRMLENGEISNEDFEQKLSETIAATGLVQSSVLNGIQSAFATDPDGLTMESANQIASFSRILKSATMANPSLVNTRKNGVTKEMHAMASLITKRTMSGVDEVSAVRQALLRFNDPAYKQVFEDSQRDLLKSSKGLFGEMPNYDGFMMTIMDELGVSPSGAMFVREDIMDSYAMARAMGSPHNDAMEIAIEQNKGTVGTFNGAEVMYPPHQVTVLQNEEKWLEMTNIILEDQGIVLSEGMVPVLYGDDTTKSFVANGAEWFNVPFVVGIKDEFGNILPIIKKDEEGRITGQPLVIRGIPEMVYERELGKPKKMPMGLR